tara:strand:- start:1140 stop:2003 length:864 start_codon:yes stop_codon:yes gene_type:complete
MPELPEVEIVKRSLENKVKNKKIRKVIITNRNLRFKIHRKFANILKGKFIVNIERFSKYIILTLDDKSYCLIHLGMSGTLHILNNNKKKGITNLSFYHSPNIPKKHNHVYIFFDKFKIIYNDPRRFGFLKFIENSYKLKNFFSNYGPEPFDKAFNISYLKSKLSNKSKNIKNYLLDQKFVSGIGNIYASEILYNSKINPHRNSNQLSVKDFKNIIFFSKKVLNNSIRRGGSTIQNFKNSNGKTGSFQKHFKVYGREGMKCLKKNCTGIIKKNIITNRSSFYCNLCQK